jgi:hypothetical protein
VNIGNPFNRPAVTIPQLIALVPLIANLLAAWGVFTPTQAQQDTLSQLLIWAGALIAGDAVIRVGRNIGDGLKAKHGANVTPTSVGGSPPRQG